MIIRSEGLGKKKCITDVLLTLSCRWTCELGSLWYGTCEALQMHFSCIVYSSKEVVIEAISGDLLVHTAVLFLAALAFRFLLQYPSTIGRGMMMWCWGHRIWKSVFFSCCD
jgi:hypothetical protein